ncbi:MAG: competence/damage-inducible protein A [Clostridiales bacterium]|nr:competence/damage-inducible protein A [Candidatus Crickella equi]
MRASILAVGTELLFGQTINTNAAFLSEQLNQMGYDVMYHFVVGDNPARLKDKLAEAFADTDLVLLTGGLGPTQDDLTKETVAEFMGTTMYEDKQVTADLVEHFKARNRVMTDNNLKQAYLPEGCVPFYNASGTAPGFALEKDGKIAICFPGPPREMKYLWDNFVKEYLEQFATKKMYYRVIRTIGIGESDLETKLLPLIDGQTDPTIATYAKEGECTFRVASQRATIEEAKAAVDEMITKIDAICGEYIYSYDNEGINEVVVHMLKEQGKWLSSAESATGGMFAKFVTDVSGASSVFDTSYVTYTNESKMRNLGVKAETIDKYSVSSPQVAVEMAEGVIRGTGSDFAVAITGNAGPDVYDGQHAGLAFIGWTHDGKSGAITIDTQRNDRAWNRNYFKLRMMQTVYMMLKGEL